MLLVPHQRQPNLHSILVVAPNQVLAMWRLQRPRSVRLNNLPLEHLNHSGRAHHRLIHPPPQQEAVSLSVLVEINRDVKLKEQDVASNVNKKTQKQNKYRSFSQRKKLLCSVEIIRANIGAD